MPRQCFLANCRNTEKLHAIPKQMAGVYYDVSGRKNLGSKDEFILNNYKKYTICSEHFTADCFLTWGMRETIHSSAIPTLKMPEIQVR